VRLRRDHPVFRRRRWFQGRAIDGSGGSDIAWFKPGGESMTDADWREGFAKSLGVFLNGAAIATLDERGERIEDDSFLLLFNAHWDPLEFRLPPFAQHDRWVQLLDTTDACMRREPPQFGPGWRLLVEGRALVVLRETAA
jgi:glycogen operon protein